MMLKVDTITKQYGNFQLNCSLEVPVGQITGFVGPNGAGKSTTLKAILGLISTDSGSIQIHGKNIEELSASDKQDLGVVLADSGFSGYFTVEDIYRIMSQMYPKFQKAEFRNRCEQSKLPMKKPIKEFSTGMRAKLHLLLAMSHEARLLILDEPTVGLDVITREEMLDLLRDYMEPGNRSILISSHISSDLEHLCDDLYMISDGKIILHEDTDVLLSDYGTLKVTENQYHMLEKRYILKKKKDAYGYSCLTNKIQYYKENAPELVAEKGTIDDVITLMIRGERV